MTLAINPNSKQLPLFEDEGAVRGGRKGKNGDLNKLSPIDRPAHQWFRFVLSYPPHLVAHYLQEFGVNPGQRVLDPFCGTGTTIVECKKHGVESVGIEANRMAYFASQTKVNWSINPRHFVEHATFVADMAARRLARDGVPDEGKHAQVAVGLKTLSSEKLKLLLANSISPLPLHKTLVLLEEIERQPGPFSDHEKLALARAVVYEIGNLHFGPEVGVGKPKADSPVLGPWLRGIKEMASDIALLNQLPGARVDLFNADARRMASIIEPESIDAVITSPPYPNEKDYTRTTRLESVLLGFLTSKEDLRRMKNNLMRSNTRNVYKDDDDHHYIANNTAVHELADEIERRRIEMGKTSGFERMYHRVTRLYFGGMARHLSELRSVLRPGARLAYVVGDQASYLRVMIRTGTLLADIASGLGYEVAGIDLFRTRLATTTKEQLREEVVLLRWPKPRLKPKGRKKGSSSHE